MISSVWECWFSIHFISFLYYWEEMGDSITVSCLSFFEWAVGNLLGIFLTRILQHQRNMSMESHLPSPSCPCESCNHSVILPWVEIVINGSLWCEALCLHQDELHQVHSGWMVTMVMKDYSVWLVKQFHYNRKKAWYVCLVIHLFLLSIKLILLLILKINYI